MTDPYYQDDAVTIYHGDCREITTWDTADALVVDPPYGMKLTTGERVGWSSRWAGVTIAGDESTAVRDWILEWWCRRRTARDAIRPALVFGTWKVPAPRDVRETLVWDKVVSTGMGALDIPWRPSWESIYVLGHGFQGSRDHGVLRFPLPTLAPDRKWHPTPKPVELMRYLIGRCPDGVIADPCMGAGATLRAAKDLGRKAIGVEVNEAYCEIAARRMAQEVLDFGASA